MDAQTVTIGITFSAVEELRAWRDELGANYQLLSDADRSVAMLFGAATDAAQEKATRLSVLIGSDGRVVQTYEGFDVPTHVEQVLSDIAAA